jgi:iron complex outermembrane receptor protein
MLLLVTIRRLPAALAALMLLSAAESLAAQTPPAPRLDTVAIVASRTRVADPARSIRVITRDEIARSSARTVADVLATAMGVDVYGRSAAQADVSIRGSSAEQVVVLVDGVRMTDVQSAHYTLDLAVPLASVERIEILRGAGSALYGPDAVGGVINIVTRRAATEASVHSGSFGTVGGSVSSGTGRGALALGASGDFDKSDGHRDGTDYRNGQGRLTLSAPVAAGTLLANVALGVRDFGAADFYGPYDSKERTSTATLDSRWGRALGAWALEVSGATRRHRDRYVLVRDNPALYENRHLSWQTGGELLARRHAGPLAVALGADAAHDQLASARLGGHREWRTALFAEASAGDQAAWTVHAGARGDHSSVYGDFFSPSLSASTRVMRWLALHTSGGLGFRAPTWTERFYVDPSNQGDPDLRPERFWTGDVGARATAGAWTFDATTFTRRATRLIDWVKPADAPGAVWQTMNVGKATYRGLETSLGLPSVHGTEASLFGSWLALDTPEETRLIGKYALRPITRQAGLRVSTPTGRAFSARLDLVDARRATEDSYVTGDARLAWERRAVRFTLDVRNLTDAEWLDASGKPAAGRGVYAGLEWRR